MPQPPKRTDLRDQAAAKVTDVTESYVSKVKETIADFDAALPILS